MAKIKTIMLMVAGMAIGLLMVYIGITNDLCTRINDFTPEQQAGMRLSTEICELPIWQRL